MGASDIKVLFQRSEYLSISSQQRNLTRTYREISEFCDVLVRGQVGSCIAMLDLGHDMVVHMLIQATASGSFQIHRGAAWGSRPHCGGLSGSSFKLAPGVLFPVMVSSPTRSAVNLATR